MNMLRATLILLGLLVLVSSAQAKYSGGSGTAEDPYQISTAADMNAIGTDSNDWDKYFLVTNDIDMSSIPGTAYNLIFPFTGVFDGNNHTISNFSFVPTTGGAGLFGNVDGGAVKDLGLIDPNVDGGTSWAWLGSLAGSIEGGATISNCYVEGGSVSGWSYIGGLVGEIDNPGGGGTLSNCYATCNVTCYYLCAGGLLGRIEAGTVTNCYATGTVTATSHDFLSGIAGGLVGGNYGGMIENSYATGNVIEEGDSPTGKSGGLLGYNEDFYGVSIVNNCYATGNVSGTTAVGGLVGDNTSGTSVTNCYSTGSVSGTSGVGGLIGANTGTVTDSFWDKETSGKDTSAGGTGKTTAEMKREGTFVNWDFVEIWNIGEEQTYPFLRVYPAGDLNHDGRVDLVDFAIIANNWQIGVE